MIRSYQGQLPQIPASCYVDLSAQIIGDVTLGERSSVWMNAVLRGDVHSIRVGANSNVQDCAVLHGQRNLYPVIVGDWVTIGHNATVHGCVVEDEVLIGIGRQSTEQLPYRRRLHHRRRRRGPRGDRRSRPARSGPASPPNSAANLTDADHALILEYAKNYLDYVELYLKETAG